MKDDAAAAQSIVRNSGHRRGGTAENCRQGALELIHPACPGNSGVPMYVLLSFSTVQDLADFLEKAPNLMQTPYQ